MCQVGKAAYVYTSQTPDFTTCWWVTNHRWRIRICTLLLFLQFPDVQCWIFSWILTTEFVKWNKMERKLPVEYYTFYFFKQIEYFVSELWKVNMYYWIFEEKGWEKKVMAKSCCRYWLKQMENILCFSVDTRAPMGLVP